VTYTFNVIICNYVVMNDVHACATASTTFSAVHVLIERPLKACNSCPRWWSAYL